MLRVFILFVFVFWVGVFLAKTGIHEDPLLTEIKRRYGILANAVRGDPIFGAIYTNRPIITGTPKGGSVIGSNVNKGYEITLCLDGGIDSIDNVMNVFLHELSHQTVPEYEHTERFWGNFSALKEIAGNLGIYQDSKVSEQYCGQKLSVSQ